MRKVLLAGNWKMHKNRADLSKFLDEFASSAPAAYRSSSKIEVLIAPPFTLLADALVKTTGTSISVAAQNCHASDSGAFTGEVSAPMLRDIGIQTVIVGHSERRQFFGDTDEIVAKKVMACFQHGLRPIMCVGESLADRQGGLTNQVLERQLNALLSVTQDLKNLVLAYEPIWAIGTGHTASNEQAEQAHAFIRNLLKTHSQAKSNEVLLLYGGSVKSSNVRGLLDQPNIDGALIGGASLDAKEFAAIVGLGLERG